MDDLLKQLEGVVVGAAPAAAKASSGKRRQPSGRAQSGGGDVLGGLGDLLGGGGLGGLLGGLLGGGGGGGNASAGGSGGGDILGKLGTYGPILVALLPALLNMLGSQSRGGRTGAHGLLADMEAKGLGDKAASWVSGGPNQPISPAEAARALGPAKVKRLSAETGLPPAQVKQGLAALLPEVMNHLSPDGSLPAPDQLQGMIAGMLGGRR